jgi:tetratricopeptide (TPR) repeat protein
MRFADRSLAVAVLALSALMGACSSLPSLPSFMSSTPSAAQPADATVAQSKDRGAAGTTTAAKPAAAPTSAAAKPAAAPPTPAPGATPVNPAVQRAFDSARQALAAGRTADAERGFAALTKSNPELAGPHANLGLIHRQAGRNAEAIAALERAVQLAPQRAELHNQLGIAYRTAGEFAKAKASYERSIAVDPNYAAAVLNLGILYDLYLWDGAHALELYDRYLQLVPGGDDQVRRWVTDLRNRNPQKSIAQRKEQG